MSVQCTFMDSTGLRKLAERKKKKPNLPEFECKQTTFLNTNDTGKKEKPF